MINIDMKRSKKQYVLGVLLLSLASSVLLMACNSGNSSTTSAVNMSTLAEYKASLHYTSGRFNMESDDLGGSITQQQSFTVLTGTTLNLLAVRVTHFSTSTCAYGSGIGSVIIDGGTSGVEFPAGTYTSTNHSNYALYTKLATAAPPERALGVRFDYKYNTANGGPGWVSSPCMATGLGNYDKGPAAACTGESSTCGFSTIQADILPSEFRTAIFVTNSTHNGNFAGDNASKSWYDNADTFCMTDSAIPVRGAGSNWAALLYGPGRLTGVTGHQDYYRSDYQTVILKSSSTGGLGWLNIESINTIPPTFTANLESSIESEGWAVWTGAFSGSQTYTCNAWSSEQHSALGVIGNSDGTDSSWAQTTSAKVCSLPLPVYCVQQDN